MVVGAGKGVPFVVAEECGRLKWPWNPMEAIALGTSTRGGRRGSFIFLLDLHPILSLLLLPLFTPLIHFFSSSLKQIKKPLSCSRRVNLFFPFLFLFTIHSRYVDTASCCFPVATFPPPCNAAHTPLSLTYRGGCIPCLLPPVHQAKRSLVGESFVLICIGRLRENFEICDSAVQLPVSPLESR